MAKIKQGLTAKYQLNRSAEIEETVFAPGDEVEVVATWKDRYLVKDRDGHYYNLEKNAVEQ